MPSQMLKNCRLSSSRLKRPCSSRAVSLRSSKKYLKMSMIPKIRRLFLRKVVSSDNKIAVKKRVTMHSSLKNTRSINLNVRSTETMSQSWNRNYRCIALLQSLTLVSQLQICRKEVKRRVLMALLPHRHLLPTKLTLIQTMGW